MSDSVSDSRVRSRVLTLVFTDLADSTALKTERGDVVVGELIARHREHVTQLAEACSGRIIDWAGDGCFLTFETSSAGVLFALRLQQAHGEDRDLPKVRVGIHMGEVTEKPNPEGDEKHPRVEGLAVDIAARICGLAKPGQVLMSSAVYHSARQRMGVDTLGKPILWQAHGTYALKGFDDPLDIGEVGFEGLAPLLAPRAGDKARLIQRAGAGRSRRWVYGAAAAVTLVVVLLLAGNLPERMQPADETAVVPRDMSGGMGSLAVLPLDNLSNDPDQEYFADGMTEAITAELAKISSLKVISRTSVMQYKDTTKPLPEIARELGVNALIEGSVLRDGDDVRITVQLIDGTRDEHLWAESYTNTITSVLKLQAEVALAIADEVEAVLTPDERRRIADAESVDPVAYDFYLRGLDSVTEVSPAALQRMLELFTRATELDADFARAWEGVSLANNMLANLAAGDPRRHYEASRRACRRALELDPTLGTSYAELGFTDFLLNQDWESARANLRKGQSLNPNNPNIRMLQGYLYLMTGEWERAHAAARRAVDLDPNWTVNLGTAGFVLTATGDRDEGIGLLERSVDEEPTNALALFFLGNAYALAGEFDEARIRHEDLVSLTAGMPVAQGMLAMSEAALGNDDAAREILDRLETSADPIVIATTPTALAYALLGEIETALDWLERGAETPSFPYLISLRVIPYTSGARDIPEIVALRNHPRYWSLIERMHFPPLPPEHPGYEEEQALRAGNVVQ